MRSNGAHAAERAIRETDRRLAELLQRSATLPVEWTSEIVERDGEFWDVVRRPTRGAVSHDCRVAIDAACVPLDQDEAAKLLGRLRVMTVPREQSPDDLRFLIACYADALADYPADVARYVLGSQPSVSKWFPAWAEIEDRLRLYSRQRWALRDAVGR